jgi:hypothetical protein
MEGEMMIRRDIHSGYLIIAVPALIVGGIVALLVTHAIPRMVKRMMAGMMDNMRAQMGAGGCKPEEV